MSRGIGSVNEPMVRKKSLKPDEDSIANKTLNANKFSELFHLYQYIKLYHAKERDQPESVFFLLWHLIQAAVVAAALMVCR